MDFFAMKRKKLQSYCKKHGIPANLKNVEMAERLSLIYQGEENKNPAPPRLQAGKGGLNVEVINLDSDSGADDVEALDTVAGNDSNEKTNLSNEHKLDDSPQSRVKSDHKVDSGSAVGNADACEVMSASLQKTSRGREGSNMKLAPEGDDIGSSYEGETMQMSVNTGKIEDNHEVEIKTASGKADDVLEDTRGKSEMILDPINIHQDSIMENVNPKESSGLLVEPVKKLDDNDCVMDETTATCLVASTSAKNTDDNTDATVEDILDEVCSSSFEDSDGTPVQVLPNDPSNEVETSDHDVDEMVATDTCEVKSASSQKTSRGREESNMKLAPEGDDIGSSYEKETMQMSVNMGKVEDNQELHHALPSDDEDMMAREIEIKKTSGKTDVLEDTSGTEKVEDEPETVEDEPESLMENVSPKDSVCLVEPVQKMDDNDCVMDETAAMCLDASTVAKNTDENINAMVEDILDDVHSSSFEDSDGTPVQVMPSDPSNEVETSDLDVQEMVAEGSAVGDADACEVKSASSQKMSRGRQESNMNLAPEGDNIGSSYEEETMQMRVNTGNIEDNHHASRSEDENMMEIEVEIKTASGKAGDVLEDTIGTEKVEDEPEKLGQIDIHQESIMENVNPLHVSPKQFSGCLVEPVQKLDDHDCDMDETAALCLDAKNTDENSNAINVDILDEVHSSSFKDTDETPVQVLPTYPSNEVEASDLDVHEMVATGTAAKTADTSAVKFDSSEKLNITPSSVKMIGTSTEPKNNSVSRRDIGVCDLEENMHIGVIEDQVDQSHLTTPTNVDIGIFDLEEDLQIGSNKENIDPSENVFHAKPSAVDMSGDEDLTEVVSEELDNDLTEGEDANMDDEIDLRQDVCGPGDSSEEAVNHLHVSPKEISVRSVEQVYNLDNCVISVAAKNIDENTNLTVEDMLDPFCEVETNDLDVYNMVVTDTSVVKVVSEELANNLMEEEVEDVGDKFDLPEDVPETGNSSDGLINQGSNDSPHGSNVNNADLLHVSLVESSSPLVGGQVQKSDDHAMPGGDYDLGNCGFAVDVFCSHDESIAAEDTDEKTVVYMENHPYEGHSPSVKYSDDEDLQLAASVEFGKKLAEVEFDLLEDACVTTKSKDAALKSSSINCPQGSTVNGFLGEFSSYFDGEIQKSDDKIMHCGSGKSESGDYTFCFPDESIAAKDTDARNNVSMHKIPYEGTASIVQYSDGTQDLFMTTGELISSSGLNIYPMATLDASEEEMLGSSEKTCMVADPEECFGFSPNDLEASTTKGFSDGTCFDPTTLGDVMETCNNMNESMQIDVNDDVGVEDENQTTEMASRKRKSDAISDELVPTVPQTSEMDSSNFSLQQLLASDTASGDDDAYQKRLDSPSKATPMIHKENIKFDKEEVRSTMSRNKFAKRQPLQDIK